MRYKIVEKASGEVKIYSEKITYVGINGTIVPAAYAKHGYAVELSEWLPVHINFNSVDDAKLYLQGIKRMADMEKIKSEEIIDV